VDYEVDVSGSNRHPQLVVVRVYTPATEALTLRFLGEAVAMARQHGVDRYLVDTRRAPGLRSSVGDYDLAYRRLRELGFPRGARAAFLASEGDDSHSFFETVAQNAGYNWRLFTEESAALEWLGRQGAPLRDQRGAL
jgi:hypothetical protein